MWPAILIGDGRDMDPRLAPASAETAELMRADIDESAGVAVIGVLEDNDVFAAGVSAREAKSEFVGFAARVQEITNFERRRQKHGKTLGVFEYVVVEIASVGVEQRQLFLGGSDDARMRMANKGDVVVHVEISAAGFVVEVLTPAPNNFKWVVVGNAEIGTEKFLAAREGGFRRNFRGRKTLGGNAENEIGIRGNTGENIALRGESHTGKIGGLIERIQNDLEMEMGSPAAVF